MTRGSNLPRRIKGIIEIQEEINNSGRRIHPFNKTEGKTILNTLIFDDINDGESIIFKFTDGTFISISALWEDEMKPYYITSKQLSTMEYHRLGFISDEEFEKDKKRELWEKEGRRMTYELLRKEFET